MSVVDSQRAVAQRFVDDVGVHRHVPMIVEHFECTESAVRLTVTLQYRAAHPVCCSEPACYTHCLRPDGLRQVAQEYQRERGLLVAPEVIIVVTPVFEEGFEFREGWCNPPSSEPMTFGSD